MGSFTYGPADACAGTPQPEHISTRCRGCSLRFHTGNEYKREQFVTGRSLALVFALWYWELDGEGPWKRHLSGQQPGDFLFPQQANDFPQPANGKRWVPHFLDYLFVAFTDATALSPADTYPLTRAAKTLMMM